MTDKKTGDGSGKGKPGGGKESHEQGAALTRELNRLRREKAAKDAAEKARAEAERKKREGK